MTAWEAIRETPRRLGAAASQARPQLRSIISPPRRMSPVGFAVFAVSLLVAGMVGMLVLTTALQNQAFEVRAAQRAASELGYRASDLESQVNRVKGPESLGRRATALGMVPNTHAVFIDTRSGEVVGQPIATRGDEMPSLKVAPTAVPVPDVPVDPAAGPAADAAAAPEASAAEAPAAEEPAAEGEAVPDLPPPAEDGPTTQETAG